MQNLLSFLRNQAKTKLYTLYESKQTAFELRQPYTEREYVQSETTIWEIYEVGKHKTFFY